MRNSTGRRHHQELVALPADDHVPRCGVRARSGAGRREDGVDMIGRQLAEAVRPASTSAKAWPWRVDRATNSSSSRSPRRRLPRPVTGSVSLPSTSRARRPARLTAIAPPPRRFHHPGRPGLPPRRVVRAPERSSEARTRAGAPFSTISGATGSRGGAPAPPSGGAGRRDHDDGVRCGAFERWPSSRAPTSGVPNLGGKRAGTSGSFPPRQRRERGLCRSAEQSYL